MKISAALDGPSGPVLWIESPGHGGLTSARSLSVLSLTTELRRIDIIRMMGDAAHFGPARTSLRTERLRVHETHRMAGRKLTVVISQGQGLNPAKRHLEEELAARLIMDSSLNVSIVPHLYDMTADHSGMLFLRSVPGDLVVLSWLYPRAARWTLNRQGVRGKEGTTLLVTDDDEETREFSGVGATEVGLPWRR